MMKTHYLFTSLIFSCSVSFAQITTAPNGNVGVGTSAPLQKFTIKSPGTLTGSSSTDYDFGITDGSTYQVQLMGLVNSDSNYGLFQVIKGGIGAGNLVMQTQGGHVGIGTTTPSSALDVGGSIQISGINSATPPAGLSYGLFGYGGVGLGIFSGAIGPQQGIGFWTNLNNVKREVVRISSGGDVGIGTLDPMGYKLAVNGNIRAKEIKVEATNWPDYVFAKSYELPTLEETEKHIKEKGYLPGIPSAEEVKNNGISLGEMNTKLLQKIEELTLHLIEQYKANLVQKDELKSQRQMLEKMRIELNTLKSMSKLN